MQQVHGRLKSEPIKKIVSQFKQGLEKGYTNFYFVGSDLGSYGLDLGNNLPDLLNCIIDAAPGKNYNLLLPNICPNFLLEFFSDLKPIFSTGKIIEIGSEVQSGSDRILKLMGRKYKSKEWVKMMREIDNRYPKIYLQTHFLVGFPTESDKDFKETLKLLDNVSLDRITHFKYSARPGIPSLKIGREIPENIKKYRYWRLFLKSRRNTLSKRIKRKRINKYTV